MSGITIRPMETADIPQVFEIDKRSAALYWPERSYHFEVEKNENSRPFVAVDEDGSILGFIVFWLIIDEAHLANFAVSEEYRSRGIGRSLLRHGLKVCYDGGARVSFLEVRKRYYQDNHEDALLMYLDPGDYEKLMDEETE